MKISNFPKNENVIFMQILYHRLYLSVNIDVRRSVNRIVFLVCISWCCFHSVSVQTNKLVYDNLSSGV